MLSIKKINKIKTQLQSDEQVKTIVPVLQLVPTGELGLLFYTLSHRKNQVNGNKNDIDTHNCSQVLRAATIYENKQDPSGQEFREPVKGVTQLGTRKFGGGKKKSWWRKK